MCVFLNSGIYTKYVCPKVNAKWVRLVSLRKYISQKLFFSAILGVDGIVEQCAILVLDTNSAIGVARFLASVVEQRLDCAIGILASLKHRKLYLNSFQHLFKLP